MPNAAQQAPATTSPNPISEEVARLSESFVDCSREAAKRQRENAFNLEHAASKDKGGFAREVAAAELDKTFFQLLSKLYNEAKAILSKAGSGSSSGLPSVPNEPYIKQVADELKSIGTVTNGKTTNVIGLGRHLTDVAVSLQTEVKNARQELQDTQNNGVNKKNLSLSNEQTDLSLQNEIQEVVASDSSILEKGADAVIKAALDKYVRDKGYLVTDTDVKEHEISVGDRVSVTIPGGADVGGKSGLFIRDVEGSIRESARKEIKSAIDKGIVYYDEKAETWKIKSDVLNNTDKNNKNAQIQQAWKGAFGDGAIEARDPDGSGYWREDTIKNKLIDTLYQQRVGEVNSLAMKRQEYISEDILTRLTREDNPLIKTDENGSVLLTGDEIDNYWNAKINSTENETEKQNLIDSKEKEKFIAQQVGADSANMDKVAIVNRILPECLEKYNELELKSHYRDLKKVVDGDRIFKREGDTLTSINTQDEIKSRYKTENDQQSAQSTETERLTNLKLAESQMRLYLYDRAVANCEPQIRQAEANLKDADIKNLEKAAAAYHSAYADIKQKGEEIKNLSGEDLFKELRKDSAVGPVLDAYMLKEQGSEPKGTELFLEEVQTYLQRGTEGDLLMHYNRSKGEENEFNAHPPTNTYGQLSAELKAVNAAIRYAAALQEGDKDKKGLFLNSSDPKVDFKSFPPERQKTLRAIKTGTLENIYIDGQKTAMSEDYRYKQVLEGKDYSPTPEEKQYEENQTRIDKLAEGSNADPSTPLSMEQLKEKIERYKSFVEQKNKKSWEPDIRSLNQRGIFQGAEDLQITPEAIKLAEFELLRDLANVPIKGIEEKYENIGQIADATQQANIAGQMGQFFDKYMKDIEAYDQAIRENDPLIARDLVRSLIGNKSTPTEEEKIKTAFMKVAIVPSASQWDNLERTEFSAEERSEITGYPIGVTGKNGLLMDTQINNWLANGPLGEVLLHKYLYGDPYAEKMPLFAKDQGTNEPVINPQWKSFLNALRLAITDETMATLFSHGYGSKTFDQEWEMNIEPHTIQVPGAKTGVRNPYHDPNPHAENDPYKIYESLRNKEMMPE